MLDRDLHDTQTTASFAPAGRFDTARVHRWISTLSREQNWPRWIISAVPRGELRLARSDSHGQPAIRRRSDFCGDLPNRRPTRFLHRPNHREIFPHLTTVYRWVKPGSGKSDPHAPPLARRYSNAGQHPYAQSHHCRWAAEAGQDHSGYATAVTQAPRWRTRSLASRNDQAVRLRSLPLARAALVPCRSLRAARRGRRAVIHRRLAPDHRTKPCGQSHRLVHPCMSYPCTTPPVTGNRHEYFEIT